MRKKALASCLAATLAASILLTGCTGPGGSGETVPSQVPGQTEPKETEAPEKTEQTPEGSKEAQTPEATPEGSKEEITSEAASSEESKEEQTSEASSQESEEEQTSEDPAEGKTKETPSPTPSEPEKPSFKRPEVSKTMTGFYRFKDPESSEIVEEDIIFLESGQYLMEYTFSDWTGGSSSGNYLVTDDSVFLYQLCSGGGDPGADFDPTVMTRLDWGNDGSLTEVVDGTTYLDVTDQETEELKRYTGYYTHSLAFGDWIDGSIPYNKSANAEQPNIADTPATFLYRYQDEQGMIKDAALCLYENGRYLLELTYGSNGSVFTEVGNFVSEEDCIVCYSWFECKDGKVMEGNANQIKTFVFGGDGSVTTRDLNDQSAGRALTFALQSDADTESFSSKDISEMILYRPISNAYTKRREAELQ